MLRKAIFIVVFAMVGTTAEAQRLGTFDAQVINNSLKCELGKIAHALRGRSVASNRMLAWAKATGKENTIVAVEGDAQLFGIFGGPRIGTKYETKTKTLSGFRGNRNIHTDNLINCKKRNVVDLGIYRCFRSHLDTFAQDGQTVECTGGSEATLSGEAGAKFGVWIANAGVGGKLGKTREFEINFIAPPEK